VFGIPCRPGAAWAGATIRSPAINATTPMIAPATLRFIIPTSTHDLRRSPPADFIVDDRPKI
jgi:hypothetical protein